MSAIAVFVTCALVVGATAQTTTIRSSEPSLIKLVNTTDGVGVHRQSATRTDAGPMGIFVVRSTLPPCTSRLPFLATEAWITVIPIEGKVSIGKPDNVSTFGSDSAMVLPPDMVTVVYNAECTSATYVAFFTSSTFRTIFFPYELQKFPEFVLNATYSDQADLLYPVLAQNLSQWVVNPQCMSKCGLSMPANVEAAG